MGFLETLLILGGLGAAGYFTVYYVIPAMQQMSYTPYYFMQQAQAAAQQQYQQPAVPEPSVADDTLSSEPVADTTGEEPLSEQIEGAVGDALEDAGLTTEAPAEEKSKKKQTEAERSKTAEEELKKSNAEQKKKRAEYDKNTDPKKDTRYKGMSSKDAGRAAAKAFGFRTYVYPRYYYVDEYGQYWEM